MNRHTSILAILIPLLLVASIYLVNRQLGGLVPDPPVDVTTAPAAPLRPATPEEMPPTILQSRPSDEEIMPAAARMAHRPDLTSFIPTTVGTIRQR